MTDFKLSTPQIGQQAGVYHIKLAQLPQFRFEYHPASKRVFSIRLGGIEFGQPIGDEVPNAEAARHAVLYWSRGYLEGKAENALAKKN